MPKAKLSIGNALTEIPTVRRKRGYKTRLETVLGAMRKAEAGAVLPIYTGSASAATGLATVLRKAKQAAGATIAVRKHIVYVQTPANMPEETPVRRATDAQPELAAH